MSEHAALREALKRTAVALKSSGRPFALAGGYAAWARGGPEPHHDVDFALRPQDVEEVVDHLRRNGFDVQQPPEDWLFKVFVDGALVDVIHRAGGQAVDDALLGRAQVLEVLSVEVPVLSATDVVVHKLCALDEHACDFAPPLRVVRCVREQLDVAEVRRRTEGRPFAEAFLVLLERLGVLGAGPAPG
ncbi:nucleotidyltransferase family protein [Kineococcus sp. SYSU DK004]|uniref:nucleotidyltransferase family protein n=1 Tax=Kineococcus sp. SYSU DK004 TaxID=3383125 RepID=UPI003D7D9EB8